MQDIEYRANAMIAQNKLRHFGILGMKWGVRRYQNKDGSLTDAGRKRYGIKGNKDITKYTKEQADFYDKIINEAGDIAFKKKQAHYGNDMRKIQDDPDNVNTKYDSEADEEIVRKYGAKNYNDANDFYSKRLGGDEIVDDVKDKLRIAEDQDRYDEDFLDNIDRYGSADKFFGDGVEKQDARIKAYKAYLTSTNLTDDQKNAYREKVKATKNAINNLGDFIQSKEYNSYMQTKQRLIDKGEGNEEDLFIEGRAKATKAYKKAISDYCKRKGLELKDVNEEQAFKELDEYIFKLADGDPEVARHLRMDLRRL
jgi:hypothetical protein